MDGTEDIFDKDFLNDALQSARSLVDSGNKFKKIIGGTFGKFNEDLTANMRATSKLFDDIHADHDQFEKFNVKQAQAETKLNQIYREREKAIERLNEVQTNILPSLKAEFDAKKQLYSNDVTRFNTLKAGIQSQEDRVRLLKEAAKLETNPIAKKLATDIYLAEYKNLNVMSRQAIQQKNSIAASRAQYTQSRLKLNVTREVESGLKGSIDSLDVLDETMEGYVDKWKTASKKLGILDAGMRALSKIPGLNQLFNADHVLESMRRATLSGKGLFASMKAGLASLPKTIPWLAAADLAIRAVQKLFQLWWGSDKFLTRISRQYSVIKENAEGILTTYRKMIPMLSTQYASLENILAAQEDINDQSLMSFYTSDKILDAQIQLTKEYNLAQDAALNLNKTLVLNNEEGTDGLKTAKKTVREYMGSNKVLVNTERVFKKVSELSGELRIRFKGSVSEMTKAVLHADKLGISLQQAKSAMSGLLDFQSSIESELEAELLLNKSLNFERARMLALQGDYLGASKDVLSQLGDYDKLSKMNVVQLNAAAKAAGMTADELVDAAAQQKYLTGEAKKFHDQLGKNSALAENFRQALIMNEGDFDKTTRQITAQEKLSMAMTHVEDLFTSLVSDGTIDRFATMIERLADAFVRIFGEDQVKVLERTTRQISELNRELQTSSGAEAKEIQKKIDLATQQQRNAAFKNSELGQKSNTGIYGLGMGAIFDAVTGTMDRYINPKQDDFISRGNTITPIRKDDLLLGGTSLLKSNGQQDNELLAVMKELLGVVKAGGKINLDGRQIGYAQLMGTFNAA